MKKYKVIKETKQSSEVTLYRIKAVRDFGTIKKGDLGGYVENENNLSNNGNCWIYNNACVSDNAYVFGNAYVSGNAYVCGNVRVSGNVILLSDNRYWYNHKYSEGVWFNGIQVQETYLFRRVCNV